MNRYLRTISLVDNNLDVALKPSLAVPGEVDVGGRDLVSGLLSDAFHQQLAVGTEFENLVFVVLDVLLEHEVLFHH